MQNISAHPERLCKSDFNYKCPGIGYFPDLYDCLKYYYCEYNEISKTIVPQLYMCSAGYPKIPDEFGSFMCSSNAKCIVPQCSSSTDPEWVPINYTNGSSSMAVYCLNGKPESIFKCPNGLVINKESLTSNDSPYCEIQCTENLFRAPIISDITKYYECRDGTPYELACPRGRIYSFTAKMCIIKSF